MRVACGWLVGGSLLPSRWLVGGLYLAWGWLCATTSSLAPPTAGPSRPLAFLAPPPPPPAFEWLGQSELARCCSRASPVGEAYCYEGTSMVLRWYFDGSSMDYWGFCLFSSNLCCPPTHRAMPRFCILCTLRSNATEDGHS